MVACFIRRGGDFLYIMNKSSGKECLTLYRCFFPVILSTSKKNGHKIERGSCSRINSEFFLKYAYIFFLWEKESVTIEGLKEYWRNIDENENRIIIWWKISRT